MALPSFINVVVVQASINVDTFFTKGSGKLISDNALIYISSDPSDPASGNVVLDQAQLGVKKQGQSFQRGIAWTGGNANIQVLDGGADFVFQATDDQSLKLDILNKIPQLGIFSTNIFWT